jgi:rhodanese-related sulfurtransferase
MERLVEYATVHPWLVSAAVLLLVLVVAFEWRARQHAFAAVSPQDAIRLMNQGALVLDIRTPDKYAAGHIAGARHMTSDKILEAKEALKKYREKLVLVYDETGSLGASAARQLAEQGFTKAFNLRGGLAAWQAENLPVARE